LKENKVKEEFIKLRAGGLSFDKITKEINVSKPVLMKWEKEFTREIGELKFIEFEILKEKYLMGKKARVENYGELLEKAKKELKARDLKDISSEKLLNMINDLEEKFKAEIKNIGCYSEETDKKSGFGILENQPKYYWNLED